MTGLLALFAIGVLLGVALTIRRLRPTVLGVPRAQVSVPSHVRVLDADDWGFVWID